MRYLHYVLASLALALLSGQSWAQPGVDAAPGSYVEGEVVIALEGVHARADLEQAVADAGLALRQVYPDSSLGLLHAPADMPLEDALRLAAGLPGVRVAQPNYIYRIPVGRKMAGPRPPEAAARFTPNDPDFGRQWHMAMVGGEAAWDVERGEPSVVIAVVDTGVAYRDGGGFAQMEDLAGVSFVAGRDFIDDDATPDDQNGHGTHVTGTIAQATNNSLGVTGLAHRCSIMPVRALGGDGTGTTLTVARAVEWAVENGADVVNLSLGAAFAGQVELDILKEAAEAGAVLVGASGNSGSDSVDFPASSPYVIGVGAVQVDRTRASYSSYGPGLDLVAPGGNIDLDQDSDGNSDGVYQNTFFVDQGDAVTDTGKYYYVEGTSQATPHVSAAAALLLSHGLTGSPPWQAVRTVLRESADDLGPAGDDPEYGAGLLRVDRALDQMGTARTYSVSGRVTLGGSGLSGVTVTAGLVSDTTDSLGHYSLTGLAPGEHTVQPSKIGLRFIPTSRTLNLAANHTNVDFQATMSLTADLTAGLHMVSVPVDPEPAFENAEAIFGAGSTALYAYDPATSAYSAVSGEPTPGQGYFIRIPDSRTASVQGSVPGGTSVRRSLARGYNLLGSLRTSTPMRLTDLTFDDGGTSLTYAEAVAGGAIQPYGWVYDSAADGYRLMHPDLAGAVEQIPPWGALFLEARQPIDVLIPASEGSSASSRSAARGYALRLEVEGASCALARIDGRTQALLAPAPPGAEAGVTLRALSATENRFDLEVAPTEERRGDPVVVRLEGMEHLPRHLTAQLTVKETGRAVSLRRQSWIDLPALDGARTLVVRVMPRTLSLSLTIHAAATARGVATVEYRVSAPATVSAVVLNQAGRIVASMDGGTVSPGVHQLSWAGRSDRGTSLPAGDYRIELRADSEAGETARATARVHWQGGR